MSATGSQASTIGGTTVPEGVILPPPEVRAIVEKTVGYVVRNGPSFEARIQQKEESNSKFSFLHFDDPYRQYYEWRLSERQSGGQELVEEGGNGGGSGNSKAQANGGLVKPESLEFSFKLPPVSAQDYDVIKLTALYVARNGNQMLKTLSHRESKNFQFDFLKPTHTLFPLFTHLVEQYKKAINPSQNLLDKIKAGSRDPHVVLNKGRIRAEWQAHQLDEAKKAAKDAEEERIAYAQIDWHDFVVVETIQFTDTDNKANLPAPISLAQLQFASLEQKKVGSLRIEEAPPDFEPEPIRATAPPPLPAPLAASSESSVPESLPLQPPPRVSARDAEAEIEERRIAERREQMERKQEARKAGSVVPDNMKIRSAGTSRRSKLKNKDERMIKSPFTGEMIAESKYDEHVRISLLDPKWKEQKALAESRQATTNLISSEAASTVKRLASELFDGGSSNNMTAEELARVKRTANEVQWDGYSRSKDAARAQAEASTSVKEQQEAHQRELDRLNAIGPKQN